MQKPRGNAIAWDECFMRMTHVIAARSKDPVTQVGAVLVNEKNVVLGMGYNGFPRGVDSDKLPWEKTGAYVDTKYAYVCHAEENAIYNASGNTEGCRLYSNLFPCNECAKAIIQKGVREIIYENDKYRDMDACVAARRLFDAAGVKCRQYVCEWSKNKKNDK